MENFSQPRWAISESDRTAIVKRLLAILLGDDDKSAISAARVLIAMDKQNQSIEQLESQIVARIKSEATRILSERSRC
jgi:hypothetical protein